jgi:Reverse transcriptase (RNA-dependent DNA polymerase)
MCQICEQRTALPFSHSEQELTITSAGQPYKWTFLLADVEDPLLGADFLWHFGLVVDLYAGCLIQAETLQWIGDCVGTAIFSEVLSVVEATPPRLRALLSQFPEVLNSSGELLPVKHTVRHTTETVGCPVAAKFRQLDAAKLQAAKKEFLQLEQQGIVRRSSSQWSSPLHMVMKDGTWRPCGDYRRLNDATVPDKYPVPNIQDMSAKLSGCSVFSKLDLKKGFYQVPVAEEDIPKNAVTMPFGLFEFCRMAFGLRNAG